MASKLYPAEDEFRNGLYHLHDSPPEPRQVSDRAALVDRRNNAASDALGSCPQRPLLEVARHWGIDESRFDGQYIDASAIEPLPQAAGEGSHRRLGAAVQIVARAPAITGHRRNHRQCSTTLLLKLLRQ